MVEPIDAQASPWLSARVFGYGLPPTGLAARLRWQALSSGQSVLAVELLTTDLAAADGGHQGWLLDAGEIQLHGGGFNGSQWYVSWSGSEPGITWQAVLGDSASQAQFAATAPPALAATLGALARRSRRIEHRFRLGWGLLALFIGLPFLLLFLLVANAGNLAEWAARQLPPAMESQLGAMIFEDSLVRQHPLREGAAAELVQRLGARLTEGSPFTYHFYLVRADDPNAYAMPGGYVVVNSALVRDMRSPEELAAVLAHEVAHVERRHTLRGLIQRLGVGALLSVATGDLSGTLATRMAGELVNLQFSREMEAQADADGVDRLLARGIDPSGMVSFFSRLGADEKGAAPWLTTHPASKERGRATQARIEARQSAGAGEASVMAPLEADWPGVLASLAPEK